MNINSGLGFVDNKFNNAFNNQAMNNDSIKKIEDASFESKFKLAMGEKDEKNLKKTCQDFESVFLQIIMKEMRSSVMKSNLVPQSNAREMFESMLDEKLSVESSKAGGIGLGEMLYKQMKKDMTNVYKRV